MNRVHFNACRECDRVLEGAEGFCPDHPKAIVDTFLGGEKSPGHTRTPVIEFDSDAIVAAEHWHGGQSSMLYALCSTGTLARGTIRPQSYDHDGPMTDEEWIDSLAGDLMMEAERTIKDCVQMLLSADDDELDDLQNDLDGLHSIVTTIEEWRS